MLNSFPLKLNTVISRLYIESYTCMLMSYTFKCILACKQYFCENKYFHFLFFMKVYLILNGFLIQWTSHIFMFYGLLPFSNDLQLARSLR